MGYPLNERSINHVLDKLHDDNERNPIAINDGKGIYPGVPIVINMMVAPGFSATAQILHASVDSIISRLFSIRIQPVTVNIIGNNLSPPYFEGSDGTPCTIHKGLFYHPDDVGVVHGSDDKTLLSHGIDPKWADIHVGYANALYGSDKNIEINFHLCSEMTNTRAFKALVVNSLRYRGNIEQYLYHSCKIPTNAPLPPLATPFLLVSNEPITNVRLIGSYNDMSTLNTNALKIEGYHGGKKITVRFDEVKWSLNPLIAHEIAQKVCPANVIVKGFEFVPSERFSVLESSNYITSQTYNPTIDPMNNLTLYAPLPVNNGLPIVSYDGDRTIIDPTQLKRVFYAGSLNPSIDISHATKLTSPIEAIDALRAFATHRLPKNELFDKDNIGYWGVEERSYVPTRKLLCSHFDRNP